MKEVGYTAGAAVHRLVAVVAPTVPAEAAVRRVAVHRAAVRKAAAHMIEGLVVDSMGRAVPGQDMEIGHMETEAVDLEAAGEACCSQTVLEDRVMMMCHRNLGRAAVNRETVVVVHLNQGAGALEGQVVVVHMGLVLVPVAGAAGKRCSWKPFCLREACVARAQEQIVADRVQRRAVQEGGGVVYWESKVEWGLVTACKCLVLGGGYSRAEGDDDAGRAGTSSKRKSFDLPRQRRHLGLGHLDTLGTVAVQATYMR